MCPKLFPIIKDKSYISQVHRIFKRYLVITKTRAHCSSAETELNWTDKQTDTHTGVPNLILMFNCFKYYICYLKHNNQNQIMNLRFLSWVLFYFNLKIQSFWHVESRQSNGGKWRSFILNISVTHLVARLSSQ